MTIIARRLLATVAASLLLSAAAAGTVYRITDLGDFPGNFGTWATGLNESAQITGHSIAIPGDVSFLWDEIGGLQTLGTLPGRAFINAEDINDAGWITGRTSGTFNTAFLWPGGGPMQDLGGIDGFTDTRAFAINNANVIVGDLVPGTDVFIWDPAGGLRVLTDTIGALPLRSARDISDGGTVVGMSANFLAYVLVPGSAAVELGLLDPGHASSEALGVNSLDQVVGVSRPDSFTSRGWYWDGGALLDIGATVPTHDFVEPLAINDAGQVVGTSSGNFDGDAFVWTLADGIQDLNDLISNQDPLAAVVELQRAEDINEAGQIAAVGLRSGLLRAFLLTPVIEVPPPAPLLLSVTGPVIAVDDVTGTGTYKDVAVDDILSATFLVGETDADGAFVPPSTWEFSSDVFFATVTDGTTDSSTRGSARDLGVSLVDDLPASADEIALINAVLGTSLPAGTPYDAYEIESDVIADGRRIEVGVSYVSLDTGFVTDAAYRTPPDLADVDAALYFVVEQEGGDDLHEIVGLVTAQSLVTPADSDGDGVPDYNDNCIIISNGPDTPFIGANSQRDTNGDGYGNVCDPDLNDDGIVNFTDLARLKDVFFTDDEDADMNGDGLVSFLELGEMKSYFFRPPGPSGLAP